MDAVARLEDDVVAHGVRAAVSDERADPGALSQGELAQGRVPFATASSRTTSSIISARWDPPPPWDAQRPRRVGIERAWTTTEKSTTTKTIP